uniref:Uncharacterized protein n=1 Tax=Setaria italica TaxID=4555 RepID=K3ZGC8_SETIT
MHCGLFIFEFLTSREFLLNLLPTVLWVFVDVINATKGTTL